jgi:hypothetical protein
VVGSAPLTQAGLDWEALAKKELKPPFQPTLKSDMDVSHFDQEFTEQMPTDTPGVPLSGEAKDVFRGFSFYQSMSPTASVGSGGGAVGAHFSFSDCYNFAASTFSFKYPKKIDFLGSDMI